MTLDSNLQAEGFWRALQSTRMVAQFLMGFLSGLPLPLTTGLLQAWLKQSEVDLTTLGVTAIIGLPYTTKFLWAPFLDRYRLPILGRRRGWLFAVQIVLAATIAWLARLHPTPSDTAAFFGIALGIAFWSATQDILIDAYRREFLAESELALGIGCSTTGYRLGMLLAGGGGLIFADRYGFSTIYLGAAAIIAVGTLLTLLIPEPPVAHSDPTSLRQSVVLPFKEFLSRSRAGAILSFILLYKLGDSLASQMTIPFYLATGFSNADIGTVVKLFGTIATLAGTMAGGAIVLRLGILKALWIFGFFQALSTAVFPVLLVANSNLAALGLVVCFENASAGMGSAAFLAFLASQTDTRFTGTQYALFSSLMGIPRVILAVPTGWVADQVGWLSFFAGCSAAALPGMLVLTALRRASAQSRAA